MIQLQVLYLYVWYTRTRILRSIHSTLRLYPSRLYKITNISKRFSLALFIPCVQKRKKRYIKMRLTSKQCFIPNSDHASDLKKERKESVYNNYIHVLITRNHFQDPPLWKWRQLLTSAPLHDDVASDRQVVWHRHMNRKELFFPLSKLVS